MLSINADREKLQEPSKPTLFTPSLKTPVLVRNANAVFGGNDSYIKSIVTDKPRKTIEEVVSRSESVFFSFSMSVMSKNGIGVSSSPLVRRFCPVR